MTKELKFRRNSYATDFEGKEDDLILVDLDLMLDEVEPSPVPLNHFLDDEDVIDRLLVSANYNVDDDLDLTVGEPDAALFDNISVADQFADLDEFIVEPIEQKEQHQQSEAEKIPFSDFHVLADFDEIPAAEDAIDRLLVNSGFDANNERNEDVGTPDALLIDDISRGNELGVNFEEQNAMTTDAGIFDSGESKLMLEKDATDVFLVKEDNPEAAIQEQAISEKNYPKEDLERLNDEAGIITLRSVISEQEQIKKQIQDSENKVKKASAITYISLSFSIVAVIFSVVMGVLVSSVQTKVSKLTELVSILEEDMSSIAEKNPDLEINNSDSALEQSEKQTLSSPDNSENEMTADVTKQSTVNKSLDNQQAKSSVPEKKKPSEAVKKITPENKANNTQNAASWSVNLTAYEDLGYAKSKAANYLQKGIPVKVIAVDMNNTKWYRLKVGGFKNKEEAASYAAKIKKSLNLNSVSVVNN